jgi:hypothetical protein
MANDSEGVLEGILVLIGAVVAPIWIVSYFQPYSFAPFAGLVVGGALAGGLIGLLLYFAIPYVASVPMLWIIYGLYKLSWRTVLFGLITLAATIGLHQLKEKWKRKQDQPLPPSNGKPMVSGQPHRISLPQNGNDLVFFSYAHEDIHWVQEVSKVLSPAIRNKKVEVWYDAKINKGDKWREAISAALDKTRVGVLLVSPNFLASDFINEQELPFLLSAAEERNVRLLWIYVAPAMVEETPLGELQCTHDYDRPLLLLSDAERAQCLVNIARQIKRVYEST